MEHRNKRWRPGGVWAVKTRAESYGASAFGNESWYGASLIIGVSGEDATNAVKREYQIGQHRFMQVSG